MNNGNFRRRRIARSRSAITCPLAMGVPTEAKNSQDFQILPTAWPTPKAHLESVYVAAFPSTNMRALLRAMSSATWAELTVGKECVSSVSGGETVP